MAAIVTVIHKFTTINNHGPQEVVVIDATSSSGVFADLSPFLIGPCELYTIDGVSLVAENMENGWQYAKLYAQHADSNGDPTDDYWKWALTGFADKKANRYPMGKGAVPLYSFWNGEKLSYIDARKQIYGPLYAEAVQKTDSWKSLLDLYEFCDELYIRDWDGWSMEKHGMKSLTDVLNNPLRKMGHAFVLKMLLENDPAIEQMNMRG